MLLLDLLNWWYSRGFIGLINGLKERLRDAADFFSIRLLMQNFFSPFRQISAQGTNSLALSDKIRDFFDLLISRIIGAMARFFVLIVGVIVIVLQITIGLVMIVIWPLIPITAVCGIMLFCGGVVFNVGL